MIHDERIHRCNDLDVRRDGRYVLYWMQASQRAVYNHALEYAVERANELGLPLVVLFGLTTDYPEANERHYAFMIEGLCDVDRRLRERGIALVVYLQSPERAAVKAAQRAALVVTDVGYLRHQRAWRTFVAQRAGCRVVQVETDVIVPVETASSREAATASIFRRRCQHQLAAFLVPLETRPVNHSSLSLDLESLDLEHAEELLAGLTIDRSVRRQRRFVGGTTEAHRRLADFVARHLPRYDTDRNEPVAGVRSYLSSYLHFGQVSPLAVALEIRRAEAPQSARDAFLEELVVRRELAVNFVWYNAHYGDVLGLPDWARRTLAAHVVDRRETIYELPTLEAAATADPYWNAAMRELRVTGTMAGYMRMYWGKRLLEWSPDVETAYERLRMLNNKYLLDGRDPNSYAGVGWCFGRHDRAWPERPIFGKVRYMNAAGLRRKFDMPGYVAWVEGLETERS